MIKQARGAIVLALIFLAACQPDSSVTSEPRVVPLPTEPAAAPPPWRPIPFVADAPLQANAPEPFFSAFEDIAKGAAKGEFETTQEHQRRLTELDTVLAPFSSQASYAFVAKEAVMRYDADTQSYRPDYGVFCQKGWPIDEGISCGIGDATDQQSRYEGQNAFGAQAKVTSMKGREFYFVFAPSELKGPRFRNEIDMYTVPIACPVPIDRAKSLQGQHVVGAMVVKLIRPEVLAGHPRIEDATVSVPVEQYFESVGIPVSVEKSLCFVRETGEILHVASL